MEFSGNKRYNSYNEYFKRTFGSRVQKVSVDAGFTCPNRDGTLGWDGCSFCSNRAFHPSYCMPEKEISTQILEGMEFHRRRYRRTSSYIAYFQPYSNTYKPLAELIPLYTEALRVPGIAGLSAGTRPDCIDEEKLSFFESLAERCFVSLEYGVESVYDRTLERVNRGHDFAASADAIRKTASRGIFTVAHLMFGLPGETEDEMLAAAGIISSLPVHSIKCHQLQILKDTVMEKEFLSNPASFALQGLNEYAGLLIGFLERLRPDIMIERLSAEVPPRYLVSQPWGKLRADEVARIIEAGMESRNTWQGRLYTPGKDTVSHLPYTRRFRDFPPQNPII